MCKVTRNLPFHPLVNWEFSNNCANVVQVQYKQGHFIRKKFKTICDRKIGKESDPLSISTRFLRYRVSLEFFSISKYQV